MNSYTASKTGCGMNKLDMYISTMYIAQIVGSCGVRKQATDVFVVMLQPCGRHHNS